MSEKTQRADVAAREYLEQKYGGTFTYSAPWGSSYANHGSVQMLFASEELGADVFVEVRREDSEYTFRDNYLAVKYRDEMADAIQAVADKCFGSAKVFYSILIQPVSPELGADAAFAEYSTDKSSGATGTVAVSSKGFTESQVNDFTNSLSKAGLGAVLRFVVVDEAQYEQIDLAGVNAIIGTDAVRFFKVLDVCADAVAADSREG